MNEAISKVYKADSGFSVDFDATPTRSIAPADIEFTAFISFGGISKTYRSIAEDGIVKKYKGA